MEEGLRLAQANPEEFVQARAKQSAHYARESRLANREGPPKTKDDRSEEAIQAQLRSIAIAHAGNPAAYAQVASNYVASLGGESQKIAQAVVAASGVTVAVGDTMESLKEVENVGKVVEVKVERQVLSEQTVLHAYAIDTPVANEKLISSIAVEVAESSASTLSFTLDDERMVNIFVKGVDQRNISLTLNGAPLNKPGGYYANKGGLDKAESISLRLTAGTYTVTITDETDYTESIESGSFSPLVQYEMLPYRSSEIIGAISIPESSKVMPVSLRVAEFIPDGAGGMKRNTDYNLDSSEGGLHQLDTSKPVWVVVHGKGSSEHDDIMNDLALAFFQNAEAHHFQVVTIDWEEAAKDGIFIQDAPWAVGVGQWVAHQLSSVGFNPPDINVAGWSHGSYIAYEMGREFQRTHGSGVNALVALDAANNIPILSGYDHSSINFADVSEHALAIDSSIIAGSDTLAATADVAFKIQTPSSIELNTFTKHKLAVTAFSAILSRGSTAESPFTDYFSLEALMGNTADNSEYDINAYEGAFEGIIDVNVDGVQALPQQLRVYNGPNGEETISFDSIYA